MQAATAPAQTIERQFGLEIATADEARTTLKLNDADKVRF